MVCLAALFLVFSCSLCVNCLELRTLQTKQFELNLFDSHSKIHIKYILFTVHYFSSIIFHIIRV